VRRRRFDGEPSRHGEVSRRQRHSVARVQEGGEEVARKLPCIDVVLVVSLVRAKRRRSDGATERRRGRAAAVDVTFRY
jgi:hypothetical protein